MKLNIQEHLEIDTLYKPELLALKISKLNTVHLTSTGEGFWFRENGLYNFLDNVTSFLNIPKHQVTIDTWNLTEHHNEYNINVMNELFDTQYFLNPLTITIPKEFKVAALLGRGTFNRLMLHNSLQDFENRNNLLYTFHNNLIDNPSPAGLLRFIEHGGDYLAVMNSTPHSDLGTILAPPIIPPENITGLATAYESIGLEIVVETVDYGFFVTEKTLRPMYYGRPFIIVGSENFESNLEKLGFKTNFNFPVDVSTAFSNHKIDLAIRLVNAWYEKINKLEWFNSIRPLLEHNQKLLKSYAQANGKIEKLVVDSLL